MDTNNTVATLDQENETAEEKPQHRVDAVIVEADPANPEHKQMPKSDAEVKRDARIGGGGALIDADP